MNLNYLLIHLLFVIWKCNIKFIQIYNILTIPMAFHFRSIFWSGSKKLVATHDNNVTNVLFFFNLIYFYRVLKRICIFTNVIN